MNLDEFSEITMKGFNRVESNEEKLNYIIGLDNPQKELDFIEEVLKSPDLWRFDLASLVAREHYILYPIPYIKLLISLLDVPELVRSNYVLDHLNNFFELSVISIPELDNEVFFRNVNYRSFYRAKDSIRGFSKILHLLQKKNNEFEVVSELDGFPSPNWFLSKSVERSIQASRSNEPVKKIIVAQITY